MCTDMSFCLFMQTGFRSRVMRQTGSRMAALFLLVLAATRPGAAAPIRNVVLCIGDGMGPEHVKAARCFAGTNLVFEAFPYQSRMTTAAAGGALTDSAAAATAMATGRKVNDGVLSLAIPGDSRELETLLEYFGKLGKSTGLVTTSYLTDATPAGFGAHESSRSNYAGIALDYFGQTRPNVLFGGGGNGMDNASAQSAGYRVATNAASLAALSGGADAHVAGLFGAGSLPYVYDGLGNLPQLSQMVEVALAVLDKDPDGFFLMVEGGRIDHASHANDLPRCVAETVAFDAAVRALVAWAQGRTDTLILVTADHETGGLTVLKDNGAGVLPDVAWGTGGHTFTQVPVYGLGVNAGLVTQTVDNVDIHAVALSDVPSPAVKVCVSFDAQGGTVSPSAQTCTVGAAYATLPTPVRAGYTFGGWWTVTNGIVFSVFSNTVVSVTSNHTLSASWSTNSYIVTFDPQGGTVNPASKTVAYDAAYGQLPTPARTGHVFDGWRTGPSGTGTKVADVTVVTTPSDHTLYALWHRSSYLCQPGDTDALSSPGSFDGFFYSEDAFGDDAATAVRGTLTLKVTSLAGKLTAKAVTQQQTLSFSSTTWSSPGTNGPARATLTTRTGETLDLYVSQNRAWGTLAGGKLGTEILTLDGSRSRFTDRKDAEAQAMLDGYLGYYTVSLPPANALSLGSANAVPAGSGYLTLTIGRGGSAKIAGVLADGTPVSQSSRLALFDSCGPEACVPLFAPLYSRKGWLGGLLWLDPASRTAVTDRDLGWFIRWEKTGKGPDGFSELLDACGGYYNTIPSLEAHYRFSAETNDVSYHYSDGSANVQSAALPHVISVTANGTRLSVTRGTRPALVNGAYDYSAENSSLATLTFTARTGIFRGSFYLYYDYLVKERLQHKAVKVSYAGVLTPLRAEAFKEMSEGQGYYLVPDNDPALKAHNLKRSHQVWLDVAP